MLRPVDPTTLTYSTPQRQFIKGKFVESLFHHPDSDPVLRKGVYEVGETKTVSSAALILQLWCRLGWTAVIFLKILLTIVLLFLKKLFRTINGVRKCMATVGKEFCEKNTHHHHAKHSSGIAHRSLRNIKGGRDWNREKILWRVLFIFYHSYLRSTYRDKRTLTLTRSKFMQAIVDDVVEEALVMALRLARYVYVPVIPVGLPDPTSGLSAQSVDDLIDGSSGVANALQSCNSIDGTSNTT